MTARFPGDVRPRHRMPAGWERPAPRLGTLRPQETSPREQVGCHG